MTTKVKMTTKTAHEILIGMMNESHLIPKEIVENKFNKKMVGWLLLDEYITPIGEMYEVFVYPTTEELNYEACKQLGCAIANQAAKNFFDRPWEKEGILNILRSPYMDLITNGLSVLLANKLKTNPEQVKAVVMREEEDNA